MTLLEVFHWSQLLQPQFYIEHGGLWLLLFVVFAETGLFFGFFLPGDSLLFVAGIYSMPLASQIYVTQNEWLNLVILFSFISVARCAACMKDAGALRPVIITNVSKGVFLTAL
ncbi:MAG: hypothetical protein RLZ09_2372, partial [Pseudomonadota bacterium]